MIVPLEQFGLVFISQLKWVVLIIKFLSSTQKKLTGHSAIYSKINKKLLCSVNKFPF